MEFQALLQFALIPTYFSLVLFIITGTLITHYGILGDFFLGSYFTIIEPGTRTKRDYYIEYAVGAPASAAIVSASTALMATIIGIIAWYKLRRPNMDLDINMPRRRFWVGAVFLVGTANFFSAFAALIVHFTDKRNDCDTTPNPDGVTLLTCTREQVACKVFPKMMPNFTPKMDKAWAVPKTCNEIVAVKWFQLIIMFNAIALIATFALQAWERKKTRAARMGEWSKEPFPQE